MINFRVRSKKWASAKNSLRIKKLFPLLLKPFQRYFIIFLFYNSCLMKSIFSRWQYFNNIQRYVQFLSSKVLANKANTWKLRTEPAEISRLFVCLTCLNKLFSFIGFYWPIVMVSNNASWSFCHLKFAQFKSFENSNNSR